MRTDLRHAIQLLRAAPTFSLAAVLTLALGIGGSVAVFTFVDAVLFRPLPFAAPDRLVALSESHVATGQDRVGLLPGTFLDWRDRSQSFEQLALVAPSTMLVTDRDEPVRITTASVTPGFFELLGVQPVLGHTAFSSTDPELAREIVISHGLWQRWFGGRTDVISRTIEVQGGVPLRVLGVMPATFNYPRGVDVWHGQPWTRALGRGDRWRGAVGRLKEGVTGAAAADELRRISGQLAAEHPETNEGWAAHIEPLAAAIAGPTRPPLVSMLAGVALVFLIACVNVAALVLHRGLGRQRELAMRTALGATRARLLRQGLVEAGVLTAIGATVGALFAVALLDGLRIMAPPEIPRLETIEVDVRMLLSLMAAAVITTAIIGILPALRSSRVSATTLLRSSVRAASPGMAGRTLVAVEIALAVVLVIGAGLMVRTMAHLQRQEMGFEPSGVASAELSIPLTRMIDGPLRVGARPAWDRLALFYRDLVGQVAAVPGVQHAALVSSPQLSGRDAAWFARTGVVEPRSDGSPAWQPIQRRVVTPDYFDVLRLPLTQGRRFTDDDHALAFLRSGSGRRRGVAIVNARAARQFWPNQSPIGKTVTIDGDWQVEGRTVVGVAVDARDLGPDVAPPAIVYVPFAENPAYAATLLVRSGGSETPVGSIRSRLRGIDSALVIGEIRSLEASYAATLAPRRFIALILMAFAAGGLVVAGIGLYGLVAMSVAARTRELGIRVALGASGTSVRRMVIGEAAAVVVLGAIAGGAVALGATRLLQSQLVGVDSLDTATWVAASGILVATALAAAWVPARRAATVDPIAALRQE